MNKKIIILLEEIAYRLYKFEAQERFRNPSGLRPLPKDQYLGELYKQTLGK